MERDERVEIEDVVYASLGRQLRVTSLLGLLFLVFGFVLGHYVAAQHSRDLSERWSHQAKELQGQMEAIKSDLKADFQQQLAAVIQHTEAEKQKTAQTHQQQEELTSETRRLAKATEDLRQSIITRCIEQTEREKARLLQELQPYVDRKLAIKASEVSQAVSRLVDQQIQQLKSMARGENAASTPDAAALSIKSEIAPVSGETDPPHPTVASPSLLPVPSEAAGPEARETVSLAPLPSAARAHQPKAAEPSVLAGGQQPFFKSPRKPSVFIPSRKTATAPQTRESVIR